MVSDISMTNKLVDEVYCKMEHKLGVVRAVTFNVDGQYCMTCGSDKMVRLWNPRSGVMLKSYSGHGYEVLACKASCDNANMCSCGMDKTVIYWDVASGNVLRKYRGHAGRVNCVSFNEESTVIFSGSIDGNVNVWDCRSRKMDPIQVLDDAKDSVTSLQVTDHEILTGSADSKIRKYDIRNGEMISDFIGKAVTSVNFTKDGQCILITSLDSTLRLLDKGTGELLNEYTGHKNSEYKIDSCLNSEDTHIFSGSEDGYVYVWDLVEATVIKKLHHPSKKAVHALSHHPSEAQLLTASENKVYFWKPKTS